MAFAEVGYGSGRTRGRQLSLIESPLGLAQGKAMAEQQIHPHKVTKPIQLLAAWLVGLLLIDAMFLATALQLEPGWERGLLVVFAILNVPMFLGALFILQTRFRAELQEDTFYSEYLSKKTDEVFKIPEGGNLAARVDALERQQDESKDVVIDESHSTQSTPERFNWGAWRVALNQSHPEVEQIRAALRSAEIPLAEFFGGAPLPTPSNWAISISEFIPFTHQKHLLEVLIDFSFEGFQLWEPVRDANENEDVYIGSFGVSSYVRITEQLRVLLSDPGVEEADFACYCRNNMAVFS